MLLYSLQVAGEPLRLNYGKAPHSPYADNLGHALSNLEGHYLIGVGDGTARVAKAEPIRVLPGADALAEQALEDQPELRLGWPGSWTSSRDSSPYRMELLATVHWITQEHSEAADDPELATQLVGEWTPRERRLSTAEHLRVAWEALRDRGLIPVEHLTPA
jgi:hypothetical protein